MTELHRFVLRNTEHHLVGIIERLEGRVPSNDEVRRHGACGIYPNGMCEYKWRGRSILLVHPAEADDMGKIQVRFDVLA